MAGESSHGLLGGIQLKVNLTFNNSPEFKEMERVRSKARHDEAQAIYNAERKLNEHWQGVVANVTAEKDAQIAELEAQLKKQE